MKRKPNFGLISRAMFNPRMAMLTRIRRAREARETFKNLSSLLQASPEQVAEIDKAARISAEVIESQES